MMRWIKMAVAATSLATICGGLGGCVSDAGTAMSNVSQSTGDSAPLRYYGGPKSPMWPAAQ